MQELSTELTKLLMVSSHELNFLSRIKYSTGLIKHLMELKLYIRDEFITMIKLKYGVNHRRFLDLNQLNSLIDQLELFVNISKSLDSEAKPLKLGEQYIFCGKLGFLIDVVDGFALLHVPSNGLAKPSRVPVKTIRRCEENERRIVEVRECSRGVWTKRIMRSDFYGRYYSKEADDKADINRKRD